MSRLRSEPGRLVLLLAFALAVRLAFAAWWQLGHIPEGQPFAFPDSHSYWELAQHLAAGEPYEFGTPDRRVFRAPGYPLVLAAMMRVVGPEAGPLAARVVGACFGALTVGAVYWLARSMFNRSAAWWAGAIVAVYPGAIATSGFVLAEATFCLWMVLQLLLWSLAAGDSSSSSFCRGLLALPAGVAGGLAALTRPSWLLFTPLAVVAIAVFVPRRSRQFAIGLAVMLGLVVTMAPWWIRNWQVTGRFVPTTLQVGASLYDGLRPEADGSSDMRFVDRFERELRASDAANRPPPDAPPFEYRLDRQLRAAACQWAAANPGRVIQLAAIKLRRMWNFWPNEPSLRSWPVRLAIAATYIPVLLLALIGVWQLRRQPFYLILLVGPAVYFSLLHALFVGSLRYRQPAMLTLTVLAAVVLSRWFSRQTAAAPPPETAAQPVK